MSLADDIDARIARLDTRVLDWDALSFQEKVSPHYRRAQMRYESGLLPQVGVFGLLASAMMAFCALGITCRRRSCSPTSAPMPRRGTCGWRGRC